MEETKEIICMTKGEGENSYVQTSGFTLEVISRTRPVLQKTIESLFTEISSSSAIQVLNVADLGCACGPQPLEFISMVIDTVLQKRSELNQEVPEFQFHLNDLAGNDFNTLFKGLTAFQEKHKNVSWFPMAAPGSFHGRLFPRNCMHLVHSCYSVHWLSKAPLTQNKGKMYISKSSPPKVSKAYLAQFQQDFSSLLKFRSQELVPNGRMVLIFNGRQNADPASKDATYLWDILAEAASHLVSEGLIDEEKLDSLNVPYYNASKEEIEDLLDKEKSLTTEYIDTIEVEIGGKSMWPTPGLRIKNFRCFSESIVSHQFGEELMDKLYDKATQIYANDWNQGKEATKHIGIIAVLKKKEI